MQQQEEERSDCDPLLRLSGVSVSFGGVHALRNISLTVDAGQICGLIGPNGAGKTTLFDAISGVRPPTSGNIRFAGRNVSKNGPTSRARLGMRRTFQRSQPFGWLSVEDNIRVALEGETNNLLGDMARLKGRQAKARTERVREVLAQFNLESVKDQPAGRLPIGLIRMVELARALVSKPRLLLLDEPTSGLDQRETGLLGRAIAGARRDYGCAVLLVEHDVPFVVQLCDRLVALNLGTILADGTPEEVQVNPAVRTAYLG